MRPGLLGWIEQEGRIVSSYNAVLTLARKHDGAELADEVHGGALDAYGVVTGVDHRGRAQIVITVQANSLAQAMMTARAVLVDFADQVRLDVMTTAEYDQDDLPIPELVSVTEVAEHLGVSRQAVLQRIEHGSLPARRIGKSWAIAAREVSPARSSRVAQPQ